MHGNGSHAKKKGSQGFIVYMPKFHEHFFFVLLLDVQSSAFTLEC